ncbi:hypothetical protein D4740_02240 [Actinomyces sp. 2119]|uniref:Uncharacterized protein n=1 Tax=Actinomyces lilanjuaniae TaxID=2321394 RepID=A0ABN5PQD3_9ACTO|nr:MULTISPECIES: hypothetical protein [Actinomyces]AYD88880.1 hypothetical protein D5R93_00275 [Actinomyces lilanjuaniae]RJF43813.1 hypothetical protein D4740_02240 [Actinomyces sp. 2119]
MSQTVPDPGHLLPYGYPALHVDRVTGYEAGRLTAVKAVSSHELDAMAGGSSRPAHLPASLLIESFLQACGILLKHEAQGDQETLVVFAAAREMTVQDLPCAGELVVHTVECLDRDGDVAEFTGSSATSDGRPLMSVTRVTALQKPAESLGQ